MNKADRIAIVCFLVGVTLFGVASTRIDDAKMLFQTGSLFWVAAYFSVVIDNLIRKTPIRSRMSVVRYEDRPVIYLLTIALFFFFGIFPLMIIVILIIKS